MVACIHGDVCRAWMRQTGSIAPLRASCPNCPWFEPKYRTNDPWQDFMSCAKQHNSMLRYSQNGKKGVL